MRFCLAVKIKVVFHFTLNTSDRTGTLQFAMGTALIILNWVYLFWDLTIIWIHRKYSVNENDIRSFIA